MQRTSSRPAEHPIPETSARYQQLRAALEQWAVLPEPQWAALWPIFHARTIRSQGYVVLPGAECQELFFVASGLLRFYYVADDGKESNKAFIAENQLAGSLTAFALDLPFLYGVQALEPTTLLVARYADFVTLYERHPLFDRLGRRLAETLLIGKELRTRSLLQQQAAQRYQEFVRHYPNLVDRVPQYHIASYLGITDVSLSRLKRALLQKAQVS